LAEGHCRDVGVGIVEDVVDEMGKDVLELKEELEVTIAAELDLVELTVDELEMLEVLVVLVVEAVVVYAKDEFEAPIYLAPQTLLAVLAAPIAPFM